MTVYGRLPFPEIEKFRRRAIEAAAPGRWSSIWSPWSPVRPASRALLREADACSGPLDGRTHCRQFDRTRGTRYQIAAVAAGKRLPKWLTHIVWLAGRRSLRRPPGVWCDRGGLSHSADPHPTHNNVCLLVRSTPVAQHCTSASTHRACG